MNAQVIKKWTLRGKLLNDDLYANVQLELGKSTTCTYKLTGSDHQIQEWYSCQTCNLVSGNGVCRQCRDTCHKGHEVYFMGISAFFCDCSVNKKCLH
jgi:hypothetical protein